MAELQPYLLLLIGLILLTIAIFSNTKNDALKKKGIKTSGIVFQLDRNTQFNSSDSFGRPIDDRIVVRFTTEKLEWITEPISQGFSIFFNRQYKPGDRLTVYYDPAQPKQFYVETNQSEFLGRLVFVLVGFSFLLFGIYQMLV